MNFILKTSFWGGKQDKSVCHVDSNELENAVNDFIELVIINTNWYVCYNLEALNSIYYDKHILAKITFIISTKCPNMIFSTTM